MMAENKKSFICYNDWGAVFDELDELEAGQLVKLLFDYVRDKNPEAPSKLIKIAFEPIKQDLKRDLKKWDGYLEKQRVNGLKGGRPKETQKTQAFIEEPKKADNVNVNVNDNVNEERVNTGAHDLQKSNLYRSPLVPTFTQVHEIFIRNGGTEEMAQKFFDKHSSVEWFLNGSPIKNFASLVPAYIENWKKYENGKTNQGSDSAKPGSVRIAC